jgi:hypothetical protein
VSRSEKDGRTRPGGTGGAIRGRSGTPSGPWILLLVGGVALVALLWACRGGLPGVPVADDYDYLAALRFEHPLDPWGPMGSLWYWRPLARQLYFMLLDSLFFTAPWMIGVVHGLFFAVLYAFAARAARAAFDPWSAAAIAAFPLLAEPARALLVWPTGAQPLLAMAFIAVGIHEALARRLWSALLALAAALTSHDQALLLVPLVPWIGVSRAAGRREARRWILGPLVVAGAYLLGRSIALGHGAGAPRPSPLAAALAAGPGVVAESLAAQLGLDGLAGGPRMILALLMGACAVVALGLFATRREARARLARRAVLLFVGAAWFAIAIAPLIFAPDLWTPRHSCLPGLGLGLFLVGGLAVASPRLAVAFTAIRLVALLLAPTVPDVVEKQAPATVRPLSFLHLARMQRTADGARRALVAAHPTLPRGSTVGYWSLPLGSEIAFAGPLAVRTWYADSTIQWRFWERYDLDSGPAYQAVLGFNVGVRSPAVLMRPEAIAPFARARRIGARGDLAGADAALGRALEEQQPPVDAFAVEIVRLRARLAFRLGETARADSLNAIDRLLAGETASYWGMGALIALAGGDAAGARERARRCLELRPDDAEGLEVRAALDAAGTP